MTPVVAAWVPDSETYLLASSEVNISDLPDRRIPVEMVNTERGRRHGTVEFRSRIARSPYFEPLAESKRPDLDDVAGD